MPAREPLECYSVLTLRKSRFNVHEMDTAQSLGLQRHLIFWTRTSIAIVAVNQNMAEPSPWNDIIPYQVRVR